MKTNAMLICVVGLAACGDTTSQQKDLSVTMGDMAVPDMAVDRTIDVPLTFQAEGLWWDSASQALYIANDGGQQIVKWNEPGPDFSVFARLPDIAPTAGSLGQLVKKSDGTWLVTRFGYGSAGAIIQTSADGQTSTAIAGLNTTRRRIGLTVAADGTVFDGWFTTMGTSMMPLNGTVSKVALDGTGETDLVTGIGKPVGILATSDSIYISDQMNGVVLKTPLATPGTTTTFATIPGADELAAGSGGVIYAVSHTGEVWSIASNGTPTMLKDGYKPLRGIAWDPDHKRIFFSEPDAGVVDGGAGMPMLHVLAID